MSNRVLAHKTLLIVGLAACVAATGAFAGPIDVIYTKIPTDPTSLVPGARDLAGDPAVTNFRALEGLYISPDGTSWMIKGRTQQGDQLENIMILGSDKVGDAFAQEGQPVDDGLPGELYEFFGSGVGRFNALNEFAYSARARGGVSANAQKVIYWDGATFTMVTQQGAAYTGLVDLPPNPSGDELVGNSIGSIHVLNDGTIGAQDTTIQNIHSSRRPAIFYDNAMFHQKGVTEVPDLGGTPRLWKTLGSNAFYTAADGSHWLAIGELETGSSTDADVLVVDGQTVAQQNNALPGTTALVNSIVVAEVAGDGDWYARGTIIGGGVWAMSNGTVVAQTGDPITPGSSELWGTSFLAFNGNENGQWALVGTTDNPDPAADTVLVFNGHVMAREGDWVDLNGNGLPDDDAFIGRGNPALSAFEVNDTVVTNCGDIYFLADLHDAEGNDLNSDPAFGTPQAFLLIRALKADLNCDGLVNSFDIDPFVLALTDPVAYAAAYPECNILNADANCDGLINSFDIDPFVDLLTGG